jgi:hypothetical protein
MSTPVQDKSWTPKIYPRSYAVQDAERPAPRRNLKRFLPLVSMTIKKYPVLRETVNDHDFKKTSINKFSLF